MASLCLVVPMGGRTDGLGLLGLLAAREALLPDLTVTDQDVPAMRHAATLMCFKASAWLFWDA